MSRRDVRAAGNKSPGLRQGHGKNRVGIRSETICAGTPGDFHAKFGISGESMILETKQDRSGLDLGGVGLC